MDTKSLPGPLGDSDRRIERILRRARHESAVHDVVSFATGHAWSAMWMIAKTLVIAAGNLASQSKDQSMGPAS
jgi:hypothetical protein